MKQNVYTPFNEDVDAQGGYTYTSDSLRSARYVNRRHSDIILSVVDYSGKKVVDVGCGDGTYTAVLREESDAALILGIDPAEKAIQRADSLYAGKLKNIEFRNTLSSELVEKGEVFDIAVYRGVLHHVGDQAGEIRTALRLARKMVIMEPNGWNPVLKVLEKISPYHVRHKEQSFKLARHKKWIEDGGGTIEKAFYLGLVPMFGPGWMVPAGSFFEPLVEKIPLARTVCCGQICIVANSKHF